MMRKLTCWGLESGESGVLAAVTGGSWLAEK